MRDPITWHAVRRWLIWPMAAALVVALGAVLGVKLAEEGRPKDRGGPGEPHAGGEGPTWRASPWATLG